MSAISYATYLTHWFILTLCGNKLKVLLWMFAHILGSDPRKKIWIRSETHFLSGSAIGNGCVVGNKSFMLKDFSHIEKF